MRSFTVLSLMTAFCLPSALEAATYDFSGRVLYVYDAVLPAMHPVPGRFLGHPFSFGNTFSGTLTVDDLPRSVGVGNAHYEGSGENISMSFSNGFSIVGSTILTVSNDVSSSPRDQLNFQYFTKSPSEQITLTHSVTGDSGAVTYAGPSFNLIDDQASVFSSTDLPGSLDLSQFERKTFTMSLIARNFTGAAGGQTPNVRVVGQIDSFTLQAVPVSATSGMLITALSFFAFVWHRKVKIA